MWKRNDAAYDDVVMQTLSHRIASKSRREYAKCTRLDYIVDRLELADQYSFRVYNVLHDIERYSYYWSTEKGRSYCARSMI